MTKRSTAGIVGTRDCFKGTGHCKMGPCNYMGVHYVCVFPSTLIHVIAFNFSNVILYFFIFTLMENVSNMDFQGIEHKYMQMIQVLGSHVHSSL